MAGGWMRAGARVDPVTDELVNRDQRMNRSTDQPAN